MRQTLFLFVLLLGIWACQDDDTVFDMTMPKENVRFKAVPGGAIMYYRLPKDTDIVGFNLRYKDAHGQEVLKVGESGSDSLLLDGFNEAKKGVVASMALVNRRYEESTPMEFVFDTEESAPYALVDRTEIAPSWGGFQVTYQSADIVNGTVHVLYIGTNPVTQQLDTLPLKSFPIMKGGDTLYFELKQDRPQNTVIIRTEDRRGYRVRQKVWEHVEAYVAEKVPPTDFEFDHGGLSQEEDQKEFTGVKYLFDGDLKGEQRMVVGKLTAYTFLAGPNAVGAPFIIDLKEQKIPAKIRIYGILWGNWFSESTDKDYPFGFIWRAYYHDKLPCAVTVYGGNDKEPNSSSWVKIGSFAQESATMQADRWCERCHPINGFQAWYSTIDELRAADPAYLEVVFPASPNAYRYLKMVVENVFDSEKGKNPDKYVTMNELEVYTKKEMK